MSKKDNWHQEQVRRNLAEWKAEAKRRKFKVKEVAHARWQAIDGSGRVVGWCNPVAGNSGLDPVRRMPIPEMTRKYEIRAQRTPDSYTFYGHADTLAEARKVLRRVKQHHWNFQDNMGAEIKIYEAVTIYREKV